MLSTNRSLKTIFLITIALMLSSCSYSGFSNSIRNSSLVDFLYPGKIHPVEIEQMTHLSLPLKVGIAFTPGSRGLNSNLSQASQNILLEDISKQFNQIDFVKSVEVIPSTYLRPGGSFQNLDQLKNMFSVDVMMLLSYDQARFTEEGLASLSYWTIIGAYIIPGESNDTQTLIDAAVYDISSHKMLFRAPGNSIVKSQGTLVNNEAHIREDSIEGFRVAGEDLSQNLKQQLESFKIKVKNNPEQFQVTASAGYTGAGNITLGETMFLLFSLILLVCINRKNGCV